MYLNVSWPRSYFVPGAQHGEKPFFHYYIDFWRLDWPLRAYLLHSFRFFLGGTCTICISKNKLGARQTHFIYPLSHDSTLGPFILSNEIHRVQTVKPHRGTPFYSGQSITFLSVFVTRPSWQSSDWYTLLLYKPLSFRLYLSAFRVFYSAPAWSSLE